jgi:hypothetical protein
MRNELAKELGQPDPCRTPLVLGERRQEGATMIEKHNPKVDKPAEHFEKPKDVVKDQALSVEEKKDALDAWEQDARQLLTASNEGMAGAEEGLKRKDSHRLDEVVKAKDKIGETPNPKPAH